MTQSPAALTRRLAALTHSGLLDTPPEPEFDALVRLARRTFGCKIALVSLLDKERQWFKAKSGVDVCETPLGPSFCMRAVEADDMLIVADAAADPRFADNPLVLGPPFVRFYAGVPIHVLDPALGGSPVAIGTLCVIDDAPHIPSADEIDTLRDLAATVETCMRARAAAETASRLAEERRLTLQRLDRDQRQFRQAERMAHVGSWRLDLADHSTQWSDEVFRMHGLMVGTSPPLDAALEFYPPQARASISSAVTRTIETGQPFDVELDLLTSDGTLKRVRSMGELEVADGRPIGVIGIIQDITVQFRMQQELRRTATIDELTQIANRAGCNAGIERKLAAAVASGSPLALMLIDLDGFKAVNDLCGHMAGDEVLQWAGARLSASYLADCLVGRLGGDEFVVVVSAPADCANLHAIVARLLGDLRRTVGTPGIDAAVSATIGVSWLDETVKGRSDLLRRADIALYEAKRERRGTARVFGRLMPIVAETAGRAERRVDVHRPAASEMA